MSTETQINGEPAPVLELRSLCKSFGGLHATRDVTFSIMPGDRKAIIGPNGAGKTTLFNLLTGTFPPTSGKIIFDGKDITGTPANRVAHLGLARSFQRTNVFPAFSLLDNVWVAAFATGRSWNGLLFKKSTEYPEATERARAALSDVGLLAKAHIPAREISHGEQRQLELAIALAAAPRVLLLDEPAAGLSQAEAQLMTALLHRLDPSITLLIIEHDMDIALEVARHVTVLHYGRVIADGPRETVRNDPTVREIYLGA